MHQRDWLLTYVNKSLSNVNLWHVTGFTDVILTIIVEPISFICAVVCCLVLCVLEHVTAIKSLEASSLPSMSIVKHDRRWRMLGDIWLILHNYGACTKLRIKLCWNVNHICQKYSVHDWGVTLGIADLLFTYVKSQSLQCLHTYLSNIKCALLGLGRSLALG